MLAREVGRLARVPVDCFALARVRRTVSQVGLSPDQRRRNVAGAFKVPQAEASAVKGKNIVLIDDVITTGATVEACARALHRAGAARVDVLGSRGRSSRRQIPLRNQPREPSYFV
jgi:predicted amidophosphoribosyltransferase